MCDCNDLSDEEAQAFDLEAKIVADQRARVILDGEIIDSALFIAGAAAVMGVSPEEVHKRARERIKHDIEVDAAKLERFDELVSRLKIEHKVSNPEAAIDSCSVCRLLVNAQNLQRGELP